MLSQTWSATVVGVDAVAVEIETHIRGGLPGYTVVGLPQTSVRESRERVLTAIRSSKCPVPRGTITVSMAPADLRKDGALFDLPLALGMLAAAEEDPKGPFKVAVQGFYSAGELALDGRLRPVRGILPIAELAARRRKGLIVPVENLAEARLIKRGRVYGAANLKSAIAVAQGESEGDPIPYAAHRNLTADLDLADVGGQVVAKRALEIAAAGGHHLLMAGPPGGGKTMLARRLPGLLPKMSEREALEVTRIYSIAGLLGGGDGLVSHRPFRSPHHTVSTAGLVGGGNPPMPGELSLATHGVLFLDELPEFRRDALESLRQPLETGSVHLRRAKYAVSLPARTQLVASMNPCPCGYAGVEDRCLCDPGQVARYRGRVSGPLLDRIDLHVDLDGVSYEHLRTPSGRATSSEVRDRVAAARAFAFSEGRTRCSARLTETQLRACTRLRSDAEGLLRTAVDQKGVTGRGLNRVLRVARTIADLAESRAIGSTHVLEALGYRE